jgi:hypothetical protein
MVTTVGVVQPWWIAIAAMANNLQCVRAVGGLGQLTAYKALSLHQVHMHAKRWLAKAHVAMVIAACMARQKPVVAAPLYIVHAKKDLKSRRDDSDTT